MWSGVYYSYPRYYSSQVFFERELKNAFAYRAAPPLCQNYRGSLCGKTNKLLFFP